MSPDMGAGFLLGVVFAVALQTIMTMLLDTVEWVLKKRRERK